MWPSPSEPASIPTRRNSSPMGTPVRWDARLNRTLMPSRSPQVARRSAVASGSWGMGEDATGYWLLATGYWLLARGTRRDFPKSRRAIFRQQHTGWVRVRYERLRDLRVFVVSARRNPI